METHEYLSTPLCMYILHPHHIHKHESLHLARHVSFGTCVGVIHVHVHIHRTCYLMHALPAVMLLHLIASHATRRRYFIQSQHLTPSISLTTWPAMCRRLAGDVCVRRGCRSGRACAWVAGYSSILSASSRQGLGTDASLSIIWRETETMLSSMSCWPTSEMSGGC